MLPREVVTVSSLKVFKDRALSNLMKWVASLFMARD